MIQRQFYECSTLADAQELISFILANTPKIGAAKNWSNIIQHNTGDATFFYVKVNRAYTTDFTKWPDGSILPAIVVLNTRTGSEEGTGTSFTHYSVFNDRVGLFKEDTDGDGIVDGLDPFPRDPSNGLDPGDGG